MFRLNNLACFAFLACVCALSARADGTDDPIPSFYQEPGKSPNREYTDQHPNEHIDPFTGKLQWHFVDLFIPGNGGLDLKVQRSYSSQSEAFPAASTMEIGWTMHFGRVLRTALSSICDTTLYTQAGRNPVLELPDGSRQMLYITGNNSSFITTNLWAASCNAGGTGLEVYAPDGTRYDMDVQGVSEGAVQAVKTYYTSRITDRNGNWMAFTYVNNALTTGVKSISTSDGRAVTFTYVGENIRTVTDGVRTWTYNYQASGTRGGRSYLTGVTRPDGVGWTYTYDDSVGTAGGGSMKSATYPTGGKIDYTYNFVTFSANVNIPRSCAISSKTAGAGNWTFAYAPATTPLPPDYTHWTQADVSSTNVDMTTVVGPDGTRIYTHIGYSSVSPGLVFAIGLLMKVEYVGSQAEGFSWAPQVISYQDNRRPGETLTRDESTARPILTAREINRDGFTSSVHYSNFDAYGNPGTIYEAGTDTRTTSATYFVDRYRWIVNLKKDESIKITSASPVEDLGSITRTFDPAGNLLTENRYGVNTTFTYMPTGDIATRKDARDNLTSYGNYKRGTPQSETHPQAVTISRVVGDDGNITSQTDGELATTAYTYDGLNRLKTIVHPQGSPVSVSWTFNTRSVVRGGYTERISFDGFGREILNEHSGAGPTISQSTTYDPAGRVTFKSYPGSTVGTEFTYDTLGRVLTAKHPAAGYIGKSSRSYGYVGNTAQVGNERGMLTKYTYRIFSDPDKHELMRIDAPLAAASVAMKRNGLGQLTEVTQDGKTRSYGYDSHFFATTKTDPETGLTTFGRDAVGNMTTRQVGSSPIGTFSYDGLNRLTSASYPAMAAITRTYYKDDKLKTLDTGTALKNYVYDANKNLTGETLTIGAQVFTTGYAYNGNDALSSLTYGSGKTVSYAPDALGRPTSAAPYITSVTHHPSGEFASLVYANGVTTTVALNARLWPASMQVVGNQRIADTSYGYDEVGNVVQLIDTVDGTNSRAMGYDEIDRLVAVNGSWGTGTFTYDGRGNIKNQKLGAFNLAYAYDASNDRLLGTSGSRTTSFTYDAYGNVTGNGTATFAYNAASDMTCAKCGQADQSVYDYDGSDMRVRTQKSGVTTYYVYGLGGKLLWEKTPNSSIKEYVYLGGKQVATRQQAISVP